MADRQRPDGGDDGFDDRYVQVGTTFQGAGVIRGNLTPECAAAVQAGTRSWKAFFFGSFDSANFITVDKTPASLWVDVLSARIFGLRRAFRTKR